MSAAVKNLPAVSSKPTSCLVQRHKNVLLAGQLWYRRRSEVRGRSERRPFVHLWFVTTMMDVGALQTTSVMASASSAGWLEVAGGGAVPAIQSVPVKS